ncbi:ABC transporter permease subunit [Micromonospora sp. M12]
MAAALIVSASTWSWLLNSDSGLVNAALGVVGVDPVNWLTSPGWSLTSVIIANVWIGIPFNLVVLYSGLQAIPTEMYEASALDGATAWQRFWGSPSRCCVPSPDHAAPGADLHAEGLRHHLDHDEGWPDRLLRHARHLVVPARFRQSAARVRSGRGHRQPAHRAGSDRRPPLHPDRAEAAAAMTTSPPRVWWKTAVGLVLTGLMLFPVYWMINVSFTRDQDMRASPRTCFPPTAPWTATGRCSTSSCRTSAPAFWSASALWS